MPLYARDFGALGNGVANDAPAIQRAIDEAARQQQLLIIDQGVYKITSSLRARNGTNMSAYGATLATYITALGNPGQNIPTVLVDGVSNVTLSGLSINGRKSAFAHTEYKAGVCINKSSNVTIIDGFFYDCKGDGFITNSRFAGQRNYNLVVRTTRCTGNYRLGAALTDITGALIEDCHFDKNAGTSPEGGFDIEPDTALAYVRDIVIRRCTFNNNGNTRRGDGAGFNISLKADSAPDRQGGILVENCTIANNAIMGIVSYFTRDTTFRNVLVTKNRIAGYAFQGVDHVNVLIEGGEISLNNGDGIIVPRDATDHAHGFVVDGVDILNNSLIKDGIRINGNARDVEIKNNTIHGHRYGVSVFGDSVPYVTLDNNDLSGNNAATNIT